MVVIGSNSIIRGWFYLPAALEITKNSVRALRFNEKLVLKPQQKSSVQNQCWECLSFIPS